MLLTDEISYPCIYGRPALGPRPDSCAWLAVAPGVVYTRWVSSVRPAGWSEARLQADFERHPCTLTAQQISEIRAGICLAMQRTIDETLSTV